MLIRFKKIKAISFKNKMLGSGLRAQGSGLRAQGSGKRF
jgi:hypothetical protein